MKRIALILTCSILVLAGLLALAAYLLDYELLLGWYLDNQILIHTCMSLFILAIAGWAVWKTHHYFQTVKEDTDGKRILMLSALILFVIATLAGLSGFIVSSHQDEKTLHLSLKDQLQDKINILEDSVNQAVFELGKIKQNPQLTQVLLDQVAGKDKNKDNYIQLLLNTTFSGMQISNQQGQVLYKKGDISEKPEARLPLKLPYAAQLVWQKGFGLQLFLPVTLKNQPHRLLLQWPLSSFNSIFYASAVASGKEVLLCYSTSPQAVTCLPPQRYGNTKVHRFSTGAAEKFVHIIQEGRAGTVNNIYPDETKDFFTYIPFGNQHLGLVIKSNVDEIYRPLRRELSLVIPMLLFAIGLGTFLLYWHVSPLVRKLQESEAKTRSAFKFSAIGMALVTPEGRWAQVNAALCQILGYTEEELLKMDFQTITYPGDLGISLEKAQQALGGEIDHYSLTKRYYHKNGTLLWALLNVSIIRDHEKPLYFIAQIQDISKQKKLEEELSHQAHYDTLTGVANRALLEHDLHQVIAYAERHKKKFVVFFMDLDKFKLVNDTLGHDAGDHLLIQAAERLKSHTRKSDIVARFGGDEFVMILPEIEDYESAATFAEKIRSVLLKPFVIKGHEFFITTSIGISLYPADGLTSATLIKNADQALYRAKEKGRNNYQFCATELGDHVQEKIAFEVALQQALTKEEFQIYYLPQVDPLTQRVTQVEALLRWQSKLYGIVSPQQILPLAEETGLIIPLSSWIIKTASAQVKAWQKELGPRLGIAVNVAASQFFHGNLIESIHEGLTLTQLNPADFTVEIKESLLMQDPKISSYIIKGLKNLGVKITIDNFGTGYSSLTSLQDFAVDTLKIDRSIIEHCVGSAKSASLTIALIELGKNLGLKVTAEGVETKEQYDFLVKHGCNEIQGYYLSKPLTTQALLSYLENSSEKTVTE